MEFHISRAIRDKLDLDDLLFSYTGDVIFANVQASRKLAQRLNKLRGEGGQPDHDNDQQDVVHAGALFAMGLIDELSHAMVKNYREEIDPAILTDALRWFGQRLESARAGALKSEEGQGAVDSLLLAFTKQFPNLAIYLNRITATKWLTGETEGLPNREAAFEELMMLYVANRNPAFAPFRELFDDSGLQTATAYPALVEELPLYFETRPPLPESGSLLDALLAPGEASPDSLTGQLEFIRQNWAPRLGAQLNRVLLAVDTLREEELAVWMVFNPPGPEKYRHNAPGGGGEGFLGDEYMGFDSEFMVTADGSRVRRYSADYQAPLNEYEAFSADQAWMPNVVMMAKSTYVWLEQLSKKYGRHIHRLDQVPDEELRLMADRGMTALWLIGLWERSTASRTIKHLRGHADAVASAYSLKEYRIAEDLGGNSGYESLRDRAARYGVRLASDMVPNHMGIDSDWVIEHPEWFLYRWESPFPSYSFNGPDLSSDSRVEIKIEDHYYDQTDAAVAFRIRNLGDGATRYMYHGNDGTTFAWNDTAQLDYSKAAVREHVIQTILHVARLFPIIRFDAAMVLAKRHVQRLWFPLAGAGGAIPSRAENAMTDEEFNALMPNEFWREVVDRVAVEVPGTLLLAEAFWLLEGYFVRTLGMHRVYNSAFMNMLRDEENAKYRSYLKKTVEFDPDILKRYVNFMSNPDERTAIDQFGSGDKFFGCCTLLATLPGLPMFGHGQIEGYTERYGMEFKQAKMDERPNEGLVGRHQHEIAPLLKRRWQFAESSNFLLYDFWNDYGQVDENVFAYSNTKDGHRSVILYNNSYGSTSGTIHHSAASMDKGSGEMRQRSLGEGLALPDDGGLLLAYRDTTSGLEYMRRVGDVRDRGISVALRGYQYIVLLDWRELRSTAEQPWDRLCDALNGAGVYSVEEALSKLRLRPLHEALRQTVSGDAVRTFARLAALEDESTSAPPDVRFARAVSPRTQSDTDSGSTSYDEVQPGMAEQLRSLAENGAALLARIPETLSEHERMQLLHQDALGDNAADETPRITPAQSETMYEEHCGRLINGALRLPLLSREFSSAWPEASTATLPCTDTGEPCEPLWAPVVAWIVLRSLPRTGMGTELFDRLQLRSALAEIFSALGLDGEEAWRAAARVRLALLVDTDVAGSLRSPAFWADPDVRWLAGVNAHEGAHYMNKERFESLLGWLQLPSLVSAASDRKALPGLAEIEKTVVSGAKGAEKAGFDLDTWLKSLAAMSAKDDPAEMMQQKREPEPLVQAR
jgi:hypothetical protein